MTAAGEANRGRRKGAAESTRFQVHGIDKAPTESRATLQRFEQQYGFVPNLLGVLAESPAAVKAYVSIMEAFGTSEFTPLERQLVLLSASVENGCEYCFAAHSMMAKMAGGAESLSDALSSGAPLADTRLEALRRFTQVVVRKRGWISSEDLEAFHSGGFSERHVLDVVVGVALKTLSNYSNHIARPPVDQAFRPYERSIPARVHPTKPPCCAA